MSRSIVEVVRAGATRYQLEWVRCGKASCRRCQQAPAHGPYWYAYESRPETPGRTLRRYRGKSPPAEVQAARQAVAATTAERYRDRPLEHEHLRAVLDTLEALGELLLMLSARQWDDELDAESLTQAEVDEIEQAATQLEASMGEISQATARLRRRVQRTLERLRATVEEAATRLGS